MNRTLNKMNKTYNTDSKYRKSEILKLILLFPIFGFTIYYLKDYLFGEVSFITTLIIFVPLTINVLWQLFRQIRNSPTVTFTNKGIDISSTLKLSIIKWDQISNVRIQALRKSNFICIDLKSPETHLKSLNPITRTLALTSKETFKTHVVIKDKTIGNETEEFVNIVRGEIASRNT